MGLEPTTPCLQSRCSSQLSYVPWPATSSPETYVTCTFAIRLPPFVVSRCVSTGRITWGNPGGNSGFGGGLGEDLGEPMPRSYRWPHQSALARLEQPPPAGHGEGGATGSSAATQRCLGCVPDCHRLVETLEEIVVGADVEVLDDPHSGAAHEPGGVLDAGFRAGPAPPAGAVGASRRRWRRGRRCCWRSRSGWAQQPPFWTRT